MHLHKESQNPMRIYTEVSPTVFSGVYSEEGMYSIVSRDSLEYVTDLAFASLWHCL